MMKTKERMIEKDWGGLNTTDDAFARNQEAPPFGQSNEVKISHSGAATKASGTDNGIHLTLFERRL